MDIRNYLNRIQYTGDLHADYNTLKGLHRQHLYTVPFENLDIHYHKPIKLETELFYQKIVEDHRGGFCYELNGLFNELLVRTGFKTRIISALVGDTEGKFSVEYDHLCLLVCLDDAIYLADVGFGDFFIEPVKLELNSRYTEERRNYFISSHQNDYYKVMQLSRTGAEKSGYIFRDTGHLLSEFQPRCNFHQTSPLSHFTRGKVCTLAIPGGRKTLTGTKFIISENGDRNETDIDSEETFQSMLTDHFGIVIK